MPDYSNNSNHGSSNPSAAAAALPNHVSLAFEVPFQSYMFIAMICDASNSARSLVEARSDVYTGPRAQNRNKMGMYPS